MIFSIVQLYSSIYADSRQVFVGARVLSNGVNLRVFLLSSASSAPLNPPNHRAAKILLSPFLRG